MSRYLVGVEITAHRSRFCVDEATCNLIPCLQGTGRLRTYTRSDHRTGVDCGSRSFTAGTRPLAAGRIKRAVAQGGEVK